MSSYHMLSLTGLWKSVGNFETAIIKCRLTSCNRKVPLILWSNLVESIDRRGILSNRIRGGWLAISILDAANLWDAISTFPYIPPQRNSHQSKGGDVDEVVRQRKGSVCVRGCLCVSAEVRGRVRKTLKCQQVCVCVCAHHQVPVRMCMCNSATSKINSCLETFGKCLISAPFCLCLFFLPVYASLCKCLWNICFKYGASKKSSKKGFSLLV